VGEILATARVVQPQWGVLVAILTAAVTDVSESWSECLVGM
jgi:hypothetical protein